MMKPVWLLTAGGFLSFFAFGFIDNLKGPILPELLRSEELSYGQGGTLVLSGYLGFIVATLATGILSDIISNRRVLLLAAGCLVFGLLGVGLVDSLLYLALFMGLVGIGLGAIEVGANGMIVELHTHARGRYLNLLATFHGIGSLLVPLYAAGLITLGLSWRSIFLSALPLPGLLLLMLVAARPSDATAVQPRVAWDWSSVRRVGFSRKMRWYYLLICAYVAVELGVAAWMVEYLQQERGFTVTGSSLCLSAFFSMIMLGRFFGSAFVERIGYVPIIGWSLMSMTAVLLIGLLGPNWLVWMLPASGLCMSIVFPTVTASVSNEHQSHLGSIFGILFACGGVGGASGPWTVGMISDWQGLRIGVLSILIYCLIALAAWLALVFTPGDRSPSS